MASSGEIKGKPTVEKPADTNPSETKKSEQMQRATPADTRKVEKAEEVVLLERNTYMDTTIDAAHTIQRMSESWPQSPYQIRLISRGELIQYFRDRHGYSDEGMGVERHSERPERGERGERKETQKGRTGDAAERRGVRRGGALESQVAEAMHELAKSAPMSETEVAIRQAKFGEKEKQLSAFEKTLVARFEGGEEQAPESSDGAFHFLKKTAAEWMGFFEKVASRTINKVMNWSDVQGFLFRGLLQEKGVPQKGILVSDILMATGTEKFVRVPVALGKAQLLMAAQPGAVLTRDVVQSVVGDQLQYLGLGVPPAEEGAMPFSRAATRGLFSSQQLESRVAEDLGLVSDFRGAGVAPGMRADDDKRAMAGRRRRNIWSRWFGEDEVDGEGSTFVPWWRWDREERSGFRRWFVAVFGAVIFVALFFLIILLMRALR